MSKFLYSGHTHTIEIQDDNGAVLGSWPAYNNIDGAFAKAHYNSARHLKNGVYTVVDKDRPLPHLAVPNGPYGSYGIIRFNYPGHSGVGVHSGRAGAKYMPGAQHATHGCIRKTDTAISAISDIIKNDPLSTITVIGNTPNTAKAGVQKHQRSIHHHK